LKENKVLLLFGFYFTDVLFAIFDRAFFRLKLLVVRPAKKYASADALGKMWDDPLSYSIGLDEVQATAQERKRGSAGLLLNAFRNHIILS
jgi:hypothetical protein